MRWLCTGFGPFLDVRDNPSEHVARRVAAELGAELLAPLPVEFEASAAAVLERAASTHVEAIASFGVAASRYVRVERWGRNRSTRDAPDTRGARHRHGPIHPGAPPTLTTPFDVDALVHGIAAGGVVAYASDDAGGYVCNDLYFRVLLAGARVVFIHVPPDAHRQPQLPVAVAAALRALRG